MKKSLNNRIRGKRLVTGDENEVTKNEILIQDKDDKIIVKQRGASGEMENISGSIDSTVNMYYYIRKSGYGTQVEYSRNTSFKDFFTKDISIVGNAGQSKLVLTLPAVSDTSNVTMNYETGDNKEWLSINVKSCTDELVSPTPFFHTIFREYYNSGSNAITKSVTAKNSFTKGDYSTAPIKPILYNAACNVLIYYTTYSNCYVSINPDLAKTLVCYCNIQNNHIHLPEGATIIYINE